LAPGVEIGKNAVVGAFAGVTKFTKINDGEVWAGMPARKIR
jgi:acetyltransferase-like isoleucine patch superfamily enzyme